ncbi:hypothetical protein [Thermococcus sp. Bubb.Bath]|uniref:hypothetical protein n=1 Tax=Thermococcus sp. Bubb.Bath TaxID=1638242 RepID=UPI001438E125|nr:hypothetical protein [Thermococcus sp. Bubb.Bath]NJF25996.1 hypothetical protein [Thermococcus sp. Bubb.Bath]
MRAKGLITLSFVFVAAYFLGIAAISWGDNLQVAGGVFIGSLHLLLAWGILGGREWSISPSKYLAFLDMLFALLWMMLGVIIQGATLFVLSTLILILLSDPDVEAEIRGL